MTALCSGKPSPSSASWPNAAQSADGSATLRARCARTATRCRSRWSSSGLGTLYSYSVLHHPQHPAFDYPVLAALVDLDEGVRMVSNLAGLEPDAIRIGMPLEVDFEAQDGGTYLPVFRPRADARS